MSDAAFKFNPAVLERTAQLPAPDTRPQPGFLEGTAANFKTQMDEQLGANERHRQSAYLGLYSELVRQGKDPSRYMVPGIYGDPIFQTPLIWADAKAAGLVDGTEAEFEQQWKEQARVDNAENAEIAGRSGWGATLVGGGGAAMTDPINQASMLLGGAPGKGLTGLLGYGLREAGIGLVTETAQTPIVAAERYVQGRPQESLAEAGTRIGVATAASAALPVAIEGGGRVLSMADRLGVRAGKPIAERFDRYFRDQDAARAMSRQTLPELRTPEQQAAIDVLTRESEIADASPYERTPAGDAYHRARHEEATRTVEDIGTRPGTGGTLDSTIVNFFRGKGLTEAQARGIAAGIHAESRGDFTAVNPTSGAVGIGQWLGPRKAELFRRYGTDPTLLEQLEFLNWELRGGDRGGKAVLAEQTEEGVLSAYIGETRADGTGWGFMRPLHGEQREGDLARGMAALGRRGEGAPERGAGAVDDSTDALDDELAGALADEQRDVSEARLRGEDDEDVLAGGAEPAAPIGDGERSLPALRPDAFPDEESWRTAQAREDGLPVDAMPAKPARQAPGGKKPDDILRFIARNGGISYDGLNEATRGGSVKGHDLRNSGSLQKFVPGAGPLLRPGGRSLDEIGELLYDAGYFGPPETTPRPTDGELITLLDDTIRRGEKRYSFYESDTSGPSKAELEEDARLQHEAELAEQAADAALRESLGDGLERLTKLAQERFAAPITLKDAAGIDELIREGTDILPPNQFWEDSPDNDLARYLEVYLNRQIDDDLDAASAASEDLIYDIYEPDPVGGQAGTLEAGDAGSAPAAGGAVEGAADVEAGRGADADYPADAGSAADLADPNSPASRAFDTDDGEGIQSIAESTWHDIRAEQDPRMAELERRSKEYKEAQAARDRGEMSDEDFLAIEDDYRAFQRDLSLANTTKPVTPEAAEAAPGEGTLTPPVEPDYANAYALPRETLESVARDGPSDTDVDEGVLTREMAAELLREHQDYSAFSDDNLVDVIRRTLIEQRNGDWLGRVQAGRGHAGEQAAFIRLQGAMTELRARDGFSTLRARLVKNLEEQGWSAPDAAEVLDSRLAPLAATKLPPPAPAAPAAEAAPGALDLGEAVDPNIAAVQRQELDLAAQQPLRGERKTGEAQSEVMPEGLFGGPEEAPLFDATGTPMLDLEDGKGPRTAAEIDAEIQAETAGLDAIKNCLL